MAVWVVMGMRGSAWGMVCVWGVWGDTGVCEGGVREVGGVCESGMQYGMVGWRCVE